MYKRKILYTEDGSSTIELIGENENFHSIHGAIQESEHIFIKNGLLQKAKNQNKIQIFEMGFGTGLNALLSLLFGIKNNLAIDYIGIEAFPLENSLIEKLNYSEILKLNTVEADYFNQMHLAKWDNKIELCPNFLFEKRLEKLEDIDLPNEAFDLVYFDAFNPSFQHELWTEDIFRKVYLSMKPQGILMTYSAKGIVKRSLKASGFQLNALPGPKGKREITQAIKS